MNKIIISLAVIAASFGLVANAQMQDGNSNIQVKGVTVSPVQERDDLLKATKGQESKYQDLLKQTQNTEAKQLRTQVKETVQGLKTELKNEIKTGQEKMVETRRQIRNEVATGQKAISEIARETVEKMKTEREAFKVRVEALKEEFQAKRKVEKEQLKNRLQILKDEKKKAIVQRVDENFNQLNSKFAEKWSKTLVNLDEWLAKIAENSNIEAEKGKDVTGVNTAIESAKAAIASAKTVIEEQAKKTYSITIITEANLKFDVSAARTGLNNDLKVVRDLVQEANKSVVSAFTEFNKIKNQ